MGKRILMLCHDIAFDRRVISQAKFLIESYGVGVDLVCLSDNGDDKYELFEGIDVHRIGLNKIIPQNEVYTTYNTRQLSILNQTNRIANRSSKYQKFAGAYFKAASFFNFKYYVLSLITKYRNRSLHDPLPFTSAFLQKINELKKDWLFIQVHDLPALEAGVIAKRELLKPLVYDAHELYPEQATFSNVQRFICSEMENKLIKQVDIAITVNLSIAEEMALRYQIEAPAVITNAVDVDLNFDPEKNDYNIIRERLGLCDTTKILLFQGGLSPHRNIEKLVESMRWVSVSDLVLVVLGNGPVKERLIKIANRYNLTRNKVYFLDAVSQSELLQYSASADVGIIPYPHVDLNSLYCTPNKLFEFIAARLPMIVNDSPELNRFVTEQGFGKAYTLKSSRDIAFSINDFFSTPTDAYKNSIKRTGSEFSWGNEKEKFNRLIRELVK